MLEGTHRDTRESEPVHYGVLFSVALGPTIAGRRPHRSVPSPLTSFIRCYFERGNCSVRFVCSRGEFEPLFRFVS
jgi:hypothetical protein